jgi:hypothetical protein
MRAEWEAAVRTRAAGDRLRGSMAEFLAQESPSPLSVSLNPRVALDDGRPRVLGVFSFRHDAHLVPGLIENIGPMVDGWVAWDDRSTDSPFGDESRRRKALLEAAVEHGARWILAVDPAERIESALAGRIRDLVRAGGLVAYELRLRAMFSVTEYRVDGAWDLFGARRLFSIRPGFSYNRVAFADPRFGFGDHWYPGQVPYRIIKQDLNIYDFRTASAERRRVLSELRAHLDPFIEQRPLAYHYLVHGVGVTRAIPADRPYDPPFREDGGAWSAMPPSQPPRLAQSRERFNRCVDRLFNDPDSPLFSGPLPGHERGVDRLDRQRFRRLLWKTADQFVVRHGYTPDLFQPERFLEKLVWRKFFSNLAVPQSGNKLLVASYIPPHLQAHVRVPQVVWRSPFPQLPDDGEIAAGWYYLKSNHGFGNVERVRYPLAAAERIRLQRRVARWLQDPLPPDDFEWWYDAFPREIFLEQSVGDEPSSTIWCFYAFDSGVHYVGVDRKTPDGIKAVRLSPELKPLDERYQQPSLERLADWTVSFDTALVERIATEIAAPLGFARVDFLFAPDGTCFLNEVTLTPGNAGNYTHPELDAMLGRMWSKLV